LFCLLKQIIGRLSADADYQPMLIIGRCRLSNGRYR